MKLKKRFFMNKINVRNMPIEIVFSDYRSVEINVGDIPATIIDPNPCVTAKGMVFLFSPDLKKGDWSKLIKLTWDGEIFEGFTDDPRLVKIAETLLGLRSAEELQPGTIIPPLSE
jgi:hypothetical protein